MPSPRNEEMSEPSATKCPVFVFGVARNGTTLLQRLLNSYPDVCIWGEHHAFVQSVARAYFQLLECPFLTDSPIPWRVRLSRLASDPGDWQKNLFPVENAAVLRRSFRKLLDEIFLPEAIADKHFFGFKDISYHHFNTDRTLNFFREVYPEALFVFIARHPFNAFASWQFSSGYKGLIPKRFSECVLYCDVWARAYPQFLRWHEKEKDQSFWIVYEDLIRGEGEIHRLLEKMGKSFGQRQEEILSSSAGSSFETHDTVDYSERWRRLPVLRLAMAQAKLASYQRPLGFNKLPSPWSARLLAPIVTAMEYSYKIRRLAWSVAKRVRLS